MRGRRVTTILLLCVLALESLTFVSVNRAASQFPTRVFVDPQSTIDVSRTAGSVFTVRLNISDVVGLSGWGFNLRYNHVLLQTNASMISEGPLLRQGGSTFFVANIIEDYISLSALLLGENSQVEGSGTLATVTFRVRTPGESTLQLFRTGLLDVNMAPISHETSDGYFRNVASASIPVARFVYLAPGYNVTFNASSSFDLDGVVVSYVWFWGGKSLDSVRNSTTTDPVMSHQYPETEPPVKETALIRLVVVDDDEVASNILMVLIAFGAPVHDVALVNLQLFPKDVGVGQRVNVNVTSRNEGNRLETFDITIYRNLTATDYSNLTNTKWVAIQTKKVQGSAGLEETITTFTVDTLGLSLGTYVIRAEAKPVSGETDASDNTLLDSFVATRFLDFPLARFSFSPPNPRIGDLIVFNATESMDSDGNIVSYTWDFGDGNVTVVSSKSITHVFAASRDYVVRLNVTDNDGLIDVETATVSVAGPPMNILLYAAAALVIGLVASVLIFIYWRRRKQS